MNKITYTSEKMDLVKQQVQKLIHIVNELEAQFPGRHFTLDGHLVGSIGEVMAAYYYGIELFTASTEIHDGEQRTEYCHDSADGLRQDRSGASLAKWGKRILYAPVKSFVRCNLSENPEKLPV